MKILVVDDHALIREAMLGVLRELQSDVVILEAASCHQAMVLIEGHPDIALVLLDLMLPDRDGLITSVNVVEFGVGLRWPRIMRPRWQSVVE